MRARLRTPPTARIADKPIATVTGPDPVRMRLRRRTNIPQPNKLAQAIASAAAAIKNLARIMIGLRDVRGAEGRGWSSPLPRGRGRLHSAVPDRFGSARGSKKFDQSFGTFNLSRAGHDGGTKHLNELDLRCDAACEVDACRVHNFTDRHDRKVRV